MIYHCSKKFSHNEPFFRFPGYPVFDCLTAQAMAQATAILDVESNKGKYLINYIISLV